MLQLSDCMLGTCMQLAVVRVHERWWHPVKAISVGAGIIKRNIFKWPLKSSLLMIGVFEPSGKRFWKSFNVKCGLELNVLTQRLTHKDLKYFVRLFFCERTIVQTKTYRLKADTEPRNRRPFSLDVQGSSFDFAKQTFVRSTSKRAAI